MNRRVRAHGNFAEYVPLILLLSALLEAGRLASAPELAWGLGVLFVARLVHPLGMLVPTGSVLQYLLRATTSTATWLVLIAASVVLVRAGLPLLSPAAE